MPWRSRERSACSAGNCGGAELEAFSDAEWGGDRPARRSVSAGVVMRVGHCLTVWAKRQTPLRASCMPQSRPLMAKDVGTK